MLSTAAPSLPTHPANVPAPVRARGYGCVVEHHDISALRLSAAAPFWRLG